MLLCLMNLPRWWQVWQILKLAQRPALCMLGLTCQRVGLQSPPCSATGTLCSPQANISWHFSWQLAMISALSTTVGEGMIAEWPDKTLFFFFPPRRDKFVWCLSVCVAGFVIVSVWDLKFQNYFWYLVERLNSTLNFFNLQQLTVNLFLKMKFHFDVTSRKYIGVIRRRQTARFFSTENNVCTI